MTATSFIKRGGKGRPSLTRTVLVVCADGAVRSDWATYFEASGLRTRRCVGATVSCVLLDGWRHCPLQDEADLAVYEQQSCTPSFRERLLRTARIVPFALAEDQLTSDGRHEPIVAEVIPPARRPAG